jgi:sugar lactone lactonase YvrE
VSGNTATFVASGVCTIVASQAGSSAYTAASSVVQSFTVLAAGQITAVTFNVASGVTLGTPVVFTEGVPSSSLTNPDFALSAAGTTCTSGVTGTCTVNVLFSPQQSGLRRGAVKLVDSNNNVLATSYISGVGPAMKTAWTAATTKTVYAPVKGYPRGVTVDGAGNVYVVDTQTSQVYKITPGGTTTTLTLGTTLNAPFGLALDGAGNLYIADAGNNRILQLPYGGSTASALNITGLNYPEALAVDGSGNLFIANTRGTATTGNGTVLKLGLISGTQSTILASGLNFPSGVAVDASGDIFVADWGNNRVVELAVTGATLSIGSGLANASAVAVDAAGDVFIADQNHNQLLEVPATSAGPGTGSQITVATGLATPYGLAIDGQGDLFVANLGGGATIGSVIEIPN